METGLRWSNDLQSSTSSITAGTAAISVETENVIPSVEEKSEHQHLHLDMFLICMFAFILKNSV